MEEEGAAWLGSYREQPEERRPGQSRSPPSQTLTTRRCLRGEAPEGRRLAEGARPEGDLPAMDGGSRAPRWQSERGGASSSGRRRREAARRGPAGEAGLAGPASASTAGL